MKTIDKIVKDVAMNHAKIIDDFTKAYLASRWEDYFSKQGKIDFRRIELVQDITDPMKMVYYCQLRKGKLPKLGKHILTKERVRKGKV